MTQRIPKTIHYVWLGRGELDELSLSCLESWSKVLPEYRQRGIASALVSRGGSHGRLELGWRLYGYGRGGNKAA